MGFVDATDRVGLDFLHHTGHKNEFFNPEVMGGGAGVFDYDNDGDLDFYFVNAGTHPASQATPNPYPNRLFRRESDGSFADATAVSGLGDIGYGMGCAIADIDNDGDLDVFVTNFGPDTLYQNNGDGTFSDITQSAGITADRWSCSAAFLDYDNDGLLDLYVTGYVAYTPHACTDAVGRPDYCGPDGFAGVHDLLYHNDGNGSFTDVSKPSGIAATSYAGLGVYCSDFNEDGLTDIYVANDADPNNLWINRGDGTFADEAVQRGAAYNQNGQTEAGMGVTAGDADNDGDLDLFITHLINETNTFYRNIGRGTMEDVTFATGLGNPGITYTAFGTAFFDYDLDGDLDLAVVNGAVKRRPTPLARNAAFWDIYAEPNQLFRNEGTGRFNEVSNTTSPFASLVTVARGLIPVDYDGDGDLDLLVTSLDDRARLFRNDVPNTGHWLTVRALETELNRDALGARVCVTAGDRTLIRDINPAFSYLCSGDPRAHFGLGDADRVERISVRWLAGPTEEFSPPPVDHVVVIERGKGKIQP